MAKKEKKKSSHKEEEVDVEQETDAIKLSKLLVKAFNKDEAKTGKVAWSLLDDSDNPTDVKEWISTGNTILDYIISNRPNGGVPVGKLIEIVGEEASGKSLLCMHLAAEAQKKGGIVAYIDTENAMNPDFATQIGVDLKKLVYLQPGTVEEVGEQIQKMILMTRQKAPNQLVLIIWDSTAQTPTKAEVEGDFEINMNVQMEKPKAMGKMMRMLTQTLGKERICLVFTNQLKFKPGVMYGSPLFAPGGKAVPYAASVRIELTSGKKAKTGANVNDLDAEDTGDKDEDVMGVHTKAKIIKNRLGPPHRTCRFFISFAHGIENEQSWFQLFRDEGLFEKKDGWITADVYEPGYKFRSSKWEETLKEDPSFMKWVQTKMEELLVVKYGEKPKDAEVDAESLLENEQLQDDLTEMEKKMKKG
jgi:recombination protein RecA